MRLNTIEAFVLVKHSEAKPKIRQDGEVPSIKIRDKLRGTRLIRQPDVFIEYYQADTAS